MSELIVHPHQRKFLDAPQQYPALFGGVGNGKTSAGCWAIIEDATRNRDNLCLIGRLTYPELRDSTREVFFSELKKFYPDHAYVFNKSENSVYFPWVNSTVIFRHLDNMQSILSMNLGSFLVDQAEEVDEEVNNTLQTRLRRANIQSRRGYLVGNPEYGNWIFYRYGLDKLLPCTEFDYAKDQYYRMINVGTKGNEKNLPSNYIDQIQSGVTSEWFERFVEGSWWVTEGTVFEVSKITGYETLPDIRMVFLACDPAISSEDEACDTAFSVIGIGVDGHYYDLEHPSGHWTFYGTLEKADEILKKYPLIQYMAVENNGYQQALVEACVKHFPSVNVSAVRANKDKMVRAKAVSHLIEKGLFHTNDKELISEMAAFKPNSKVKKKKDRVDALVHNLKQIQVYAPSSFHVPDKTFETMSTQEASHLHFFRETRKHARQQISSNVDEENYDHNYF